LALEVSSTGHVLFRHRLSDTYSEIDIEWNFQSSVDHLITTLNMLFATILSHQDFLAGYAFYFWDDHKEFADQLELAKKEFFASGQSIEFMEEHFFVSDFAPQLLLLSDDAECRFERAWLRENILDLAPARDAVEHYLDMLSGTSELL
jgi:hypothetical protein